MIAVIKAASRRKTKQKPLSDPLNRNQQLTSTSCDFRRRGQHSLGKTSGTVIPFLTLLSSLSARAKAPPRLRIISPGFETPSRGDRLVNGQSCECVPAPCAAAQSATSAWFCLQR